jgi:hypothetical protein
LILHLLLIAKSTTGAGLLIYYLGLAEKFKKIAALFTLQ